MPRNSQGVYSAPAGTTAVPNQVISSTAVNTALGDLVQDNNNPRPIVAGGTGANSLTDARANLSLPPAVGVYWRGYMSASLGPVSFFGDANTVDQSGIVRDHDNLALRVPSAGTYKISWTILSGVNATPSSSTFSDAQLRLNGVLQPFKCRSPNIWASAAATWIGPLNEGDDIGITVSNKALSTAEQQNFISVARLT